MDQSIDRDKFKKTLTIFLSVSIAISTFCNIVKTSVFLIIDFLLLGLVGRYFSSYHKTTLKLVVHSKFLAFVFELFRYIVYIFYYNQEIHGSVYFKSLLTLNFVGNIFLFIQFGVSIAIIALSYSQIKNYYPNKELFNFKYFEYAESLSSKAVTERT